MGEISGGWVRYGAEANAALRAAIAAAKAREALTPVTVVVPSNQVGVAARRHLGGRSLGPTSGRGPGLIGVSFLTPYRLAELLGAAPLAGGGRRPVSTPVLAAAVRRVLATEPGAFASVAEHPATEVALVTAYRELRDLTPAALDRLAGQGDRTRELVRVVRAARSALEPAWYDEEDLMASASAVARAGVPDDVGTVIVHLPQRLTRHGAELLVAVGSAGGLHVIAGATGVPKADAEVARSVRRLGLSEPAPTTPTLPSAVAPDRTRIVTASDADEEVRAAVRTVVDATRTGTALDRIAILHASAEPYGRLLHDHLAAASIPTNGAADVPLVGRLASRALLDLLALPVTGFRREDVFAWLTSYPVLDGGVDVPSSAWERVSRAAGVVGGTAHWDQRLAHLADQLDAEADRIEAEGREPAWRAERARQDAAHARSLRTFVLGLIARLADAASTERPWSSRSTWAKALVGEILGGSPRQARWPDVERRAAGRLELALDRLAALDAIEGPVPLEVFGRTLGVELESDLGRAGRFGEGVLVGPVSMGIGVDLDLVVIVGMAEGSFPAAVHDDSLLPDHERASTGGELALRQDQVDRLHHQFLATVGGVARQVLLVPRGDLRRSRERVLSRWVLDVASVLTGKRLWSAELLGAADADHGGPPWLTHLASFDAALRRSAVPATHQEHRLRQLLAHDAPRHQLASLAAEVDATLASGVELLDARSSDRLTRFDGNIAGSPLPSPLERGTSSTRLESWAACPHAYLLAHILRVDVVEQPEEALQITPLRRGNLVHEVLEAFIGEVLAEGTVPAPHQPWSAEHHARLATIAVDHCRRYAEDGLTGQAIFWQRDQRKILADLDTVLTADDHRRAMTGSRPVAAELAFGSEGTEPVRFPLGDGRTVSVRGKADRVDVGEDGTIYVLDYKTGKVDDYKDLGADDPHQGGRHLQLAVYGVAARQRLEQRDARVDARYWFTSARGRYVLHGYEVTDDVLDQVGEAMRTIVDGIEGGVFPERPGPPDTRPFNPCWYCDPDFLGTGEAHRRWERKRHDPVLDRYLALVEPGEAGA